MAGSLHIRTLNESDVDFADQVRSLAGWNQRRADWTRFIRHAPRGCFLAEWDGQSAGTVTTTLYPGGLAWIGMMLVHPDFRRRGIASALMETAISHLQGEGATCIKLDATPDGEPVYTRIGFRPEWHLHRWMGPAHEAGKNLPAPSSDFKLPDFDRGIFGDDRSEWLARVAEGAHVIETIRDADDQVQAFGMLREGVRADYLGPITATSIDAGLEVSKRLLSAARRETFWDIPDDNTAAAELAAGWGFEKARPLLRMWLGEHLIPGEGKRQFGLSDPATG